MGLWQRAAFAVNDRFPENPSVLVTPLGTWDVDSPFREGHLLTRVVLVLLIEAQVTAPTRDPQALTLIAPSLKALTGSTTVTDATLQATASYVASPDEETGTAHSISLHSCWTNASWFFLLTTIHVRCSPSALIDLEQSPMWR